MRAPLKSFLLFSAVVLFTLAARPLLGGSPQETAGKSAKVSPEALAKAKKVYAVDCALCHNDTGDGKTDLVKSMNADPGDWTIAKTLAGKQDQNLFDAIRKGKGVMPAEAEGRADDAVVWAMIHHIRSLGK